MLSGETLCKFAQIFPPKDLVYFWKKISHESNSKYKLIALLYWNKRQVEKYFFILFFVLLVLILVEVNKLVFFF